MTSLHIEKPKLSILLVTYNHESYIRKALDCLFNQILEGLIEIVVADDASVDSTLAIIKEYEGRNSVFRFNYLQKADNLGITKNYQRGFSSCSGEYVAVLEGDDYWISPFKLQRQIDFLDTHLESDLCSVNYLVYEESCSHFYPRTVIGNGYRLIGARDLIADNLVGNFSTCMYRKSALDALPKELFDICSYDWIVNICVARSSMIGFLEEPMSVYRLHSCGVWSQTPHMEKLKAQLEVIPAYDAITNYVFHSDFTLLSKRLQDMISITNLCPCASLIEQRSDSILLSRIVDYMPPVLLGAARALMPPRLKRFIISILHRGVE
jgi:glycosyltransferase involved in cell wall biosynthesis